jgi:hypothetical protein
MWWVMYAFIMVYTVLQTYITRIVDGSVKNALIHDVTLFTQ